MEYDDDIDIEQLIELDYQNSKALDTTKTEVLPSSLQPVIKPVFKKGYRFIYKAIPGAGCESCGAMDQVLTEHLYKDFQIILCTLCYHCDYAYPDHLQSHGDLTSQIGGKQNPSTPHAVQDGHSDMEGFDSSYIHQYHAEIMDLPISLRYSYITKTTAVNEFLLNDRELKTIKHVEAKNPQHPTWKPMKLYLYLHIVQKVIDIRGTLTTLNALRTQRQIQQLNRKIDQTNREEEEARLLEQARMDGLDEALIEARLLMFRRNRAKRTRQAAHPHRNNATLFGDLSDSDDELLMISPDIDPNAPNTAHGDLGGVSSSSTREGKPPTSQAYQAELKSIKETRKKRAIVQDPHQESTTVDHDDDSDETQPVKRKRQTTSTTRTKQIKSSTKKPKKAASKRFEDLLPPPPPPQSSSPDVLSMVENDLQQSTAYNAVPSNHIHHFHVVADGIEQCDCGQVLAFETL